MASTLCTLTSALTQLSLGGGDNYPHPPKKSKKKRKPKNHLSINVPSRGRKYRRPIPKFHDYKLLGKFKITKDLTYSDDAGDVAIPEIISAPEIRQLEGTYLGHGFNTTVKLDDYSSYYDVKRNLFFKWMTRHDYFTKVQNKTVKTPEFICFGGRIYGPLLTPLITWYGEWEIFAARYKDAIFLWDKKTIDDPRTMDCFYGIAFEALMTGKDPRTLNEFEKIFLIQEASFGTHEKSHQLLLVSEVDAVNEKGDYVEIKNSRKGSREAMHGKFLRYWGQSTVAGVKKMLVGYRSDNGHLQSTKAIRTVDVLRKSYKPYNISKCLDFEDNLLTWISKHCQENDPTIVKSFSWTGWPSSEVVCKTIPKDAVSPFIPQWFLQSPQSAGTAS